MSKINIIYILSRGHSGSTLLDLCLSEHPKITGLGEIINLSRYYINNKKCTCGEKVNECFFWKDILSYPNPLTTDSIKTGFNVVPSAIKRKILFSNIKDKNYQSFEKIYNKQNYEVFKRITDREKTDYLVDSSKDQWRMFLLSRCEQFNVKVIYLFRNPIMNIESKKRKSLDPKREKVVYGGVLYHLFGIYKTELLKRMILKKFKRDSIYIIKYEDFAANPGEKLSDLISFLGIKENQSIFTDRTNENYFLPIKSSKRHNIGGNRVRYKKIDRIENKNFQIENLSSFELFIYNIFGGKLFSKTINKYCD